MLYIVGFVLLTLHHVSPQDTIADPCSLSEATPNNHQAILLCSFTFSAAPIPFLECVGPEEETKSPLPERFG
ncbi:hypothetical protein BKA82DRAFT_1005601 [Pisolithus tinctorius]|uniref:Secreted protein n=1 Tax=Pisolithus tinctorius Marx 270 TaxID=870435 RepID=A0A0C3IMA7_PISTI|nr:hypothetical protein BKA82DRAFT_1005601 [Pisolithus tinctorius]KIN98087.1 hypothetical protein M404DRAFT_1005601 [Pisolithus tinctorius Marx 270]